MKRTRNNGRSGPGRRRDEHAGGRRNQETARPKDSGEPPARFAEARDVKRLLEGIGQPPPSPFKPDPFQLEALAAIEFEDVLVTAPTGSGKTWIASEEIRRLLKAGRRAWYTSPLKALTNSKYQEFGAEFGAEQVGILTGDRKENTDAPLI